jgi:beta-lactamase class A
MAAKHYQEPSHSVSNGVLVVIGLFLFALILAVIGLVSRCVEQPSSTTSSHDSSSAEIESQETSGHARSGASRGANWSISLGELAEKYAANDDATQRASQVQQAIDETVEGYGDGVSVTFISLADARVTAGTRSNAQMRSASLIKLLVLVTLLDQAADGKIDLQQTLTVEPEDIVDGTGVIRDEGPGSSYTLSELAYLMISQSDNVAANMLIDFLGFDAINAEASELGLIDTYLANKFNTDSRNDPDRFNTTSSSDIARLLQLIVTAQVANRDLCSFAMQALADQQIYGAICDGVPSGIMVAHKTGSYSDVINDGAIVFAEEPYVLVVMCENLDEDTANDLIADVSQAVYTVTNGT